MGVGGLLAVPAKTARDASRPAERAVVRRQAGGERRVATRPRPDDRSDLSNLLAAAWGLTGGSCPPPADVHCRRLGGMGYLDTS